MKVDVYMLAGYSRKDGPGSLVLNDGQEMKVLGLVTTLSVLYPAGLIPNMVTVAIHADKHRHEEYGTAMYLDYKKRGKKARQYSNFVTQELVPFLRESYGVLTEAYRSAFAGFSLGGLSALDISWRNPDLFSRVGIFSGSLWWRYKKAAGGGKQAHRIMHHIIRNSTKRRGMKFWFQAGTNDEKHDRNNSGTIDAIEDTLDLIEELRNIGYRKEETMFRLVKGGEHNFKTWSRVFPEFLIWAFGESD